MIRGLTMIELTVLDWPGAVAWYADRLGLPLVLRDEANQFALFTRGLTQLALKAGTISPVGVLLAFEVDDLEQELVRLEANGIVADGSVKTSTEGYRRALVQAPDGVRISLFQWMKRSCTPASGGRKSPEETSK